MTSILDRSDFAHRLFHLSDRTSPCPPGARDLLVEVPAQASVHVRVHQHDEAMGSIVLFHGNGEVVADYDGFAPWYRNLEMNLAVVDFRGYGASTGNPSLRDCLDDPVVVLQAILPLLEDKGPVFVMGRSLGSFWAITAATACANILSGIILESAVGDLDGLVRRRGFDPLLLTQQDRDSFCPLHRIAKTTLPTLILHGAEDEHIAPQEAARLLDACAASDKTLVSVPDRGHNDVFLGETYWTSMDGFVERRVHAWDDEHPEP